MNTKHTPEISFPPSARELKVNRTREPGHGPESDLNAVPPDQRWQFAEALADLHAREDNLRAYEEHLRGWQAQIDAARASAPARRSSQHPFIPPASVFPREDMGLHGAWEKLHRARELLEAEQKHLVDDRLLLREQEEALKQREAALVQREQRLVAREQAVPPAKKKKEPSTMETLTRAPFAMAKSVFGAKS